MSVFARFAPRLQEAIVARLGWTSLRPVQEEAGEAILDGEQRVVLAPTAGGKTEASMFPAISRLIDEPTDAVGCSTSRRSRPCSITRPIGLGLYTEMVGLHRFVWHGDTPDSRPSPLPPRAGRALDDDARVAGGDAVSQRVDAARLFTDLELVVIDEIHAVAGTDRGAHLMSVLERIRTPVASRRPARRAQRDGGQPAKRSSAGSRGRRTRPGVVVDPPKPPSRKQLLVVHRPELGPDRRGGCPFSTWSEEPVLLPVPRDRRGRSQPHATDGDDGLRAPQRGLARGARDRRGAVPPWLGRLHRLHVDARAGHRRGRPRPSAPVRGPGHGEFLPPAHGPHRASRRARSRTRRFSARRPTACSRRSPSSSSRSRAGSSTSSVNDRCWPVLIHQLARHVARG